MSCEIIFGGSFDPIHAGHMRLARTALRELAADRLFLIPTCDSPYKVGLKNASDEQRAEMCRIACRDEPRIEVSDCEIRRGGVSFTYLTVREFAQPGKKLYLLTGADAFLTVQNWKYAALIKQNVFVVGGCRKGGEREMLQRHADFLAALGFAVRLLDYEPLPVSSTELRTAIEDRESTEGLLDPAVREYIDAHGLYGR